LNKPEKHLCIDVDNVLAQTDSVIRRLIRERSSFRVDLRYEHIVTFNYYECSDSRGRGISMAEWTAIHLEFSRSQSITSIEPYPECISVLSSLASRYVLHIVTSRLPCARKPTADWLDSHAFPAHTLHFVGHREKHLLPERFAAAIEDDPEQALCFARAGTPTIVLAHPWNSGCADQLVTRVASWAEIGRLLTE
jgi:uncharacterized HAD superfamily protein